MRRCLIRSDASASIGGGHVMRCIALAGAIRAHGFEVVFAVSPETMTIYPDLLARFPGSVATCTTGTASVEAIAPLGRFDVCIADGYSFTAEDEQMLARHAGLVIAIDDWPERQHHVDILIDQTLGREPAEYDGFLPEAAARLCGSQYALLRPEFAARRAAGLPERAVTASPSVLVSFGLTDPLDTTSLALDLLEGTGAVPTVVIGEQAPNRHRVLDKIGNFPGARMEGQVGAARMADLIAGSDWVFGAPGTSSYERCCLGAPSLLLSVADNQFPNAQALVKAGAGIFVGDARNLERGVARRQVAAALADPAQADGLGARAAALCDGRGATRIADFIASHIQSNASIHHDSKRYRTS
jgi:UDP-2,4-diacetamido-2,4,6-trideoxy-beta-L-altropyranose hydrolase